MTFQHNLPSGPCTYPGHINTAPTCTISLKLVLVFVLASNLPLLLLPSPLRKTLVSKSSDIGTCIVLGCQYDGLVVDCPVSSWSPIGRMSVSSWVSPTQEAGRKEYVCVRLASLTPTNGSFLFPLPCYDSLGQNTRCRSANLYLWHFPFDWTIAFHYDFLL